MIVENPVIRGFSPDPSLLKVGEDYYIATSTFEWFPGVAIYHSKDLVNWELSDYALKNDTWMDLSGIDTSCGIWAPNLTYDKGRFYLLYTIVYTNHHWYKDTWNYMTSAPSVHGPWTEPVALNRSGFDPSLFHDDDGRNYLVNMVMGHHPDETHRFDGIDVQEINEETGELYGKPVRVFTGSRFGFTEGPNIFKHNGEYYLFCAAGGTESGHAEIVARSKNLFGPYEETEKSLFLTSVGHDDCKLKRAGHAQIVCTEDGNWYMAHLCGTPVQDRCILGRETAIQNLCWTEDGYPRIRDREDNGPNDTYEVPFDVPIIRQNEEIVDFSKRNSLPLEYMTLRKSAAKQGISVSDGTLKIVGGCSLNSLYHQGLAARRLRSLDADFMTQMHFDPASENHMAGIAAYYNFDNFMYLRLLRTAEGKVLNVLVCENKEIRESEFIRIPDETDAIGLKLEIRKEQIRFFYTCGAGMAEHADDFCWKPISTVEDMTHLSDEYIAGNGFTGTMLALCCQDLQGDHAVASFDWIRYIEK